MTTCAPTPPALTGSGHGPAGSCAGRLRDPAGPLAGRAEPDRGKRRPDSALRLEGYRTGIAWPGEPIGRLVRDRDGGVSPLALRGAVTAASQHRACTARPGGEPAVRKPRTVALSAGSPLAAGAAAAHDPPRPIQPGGRAKQRERDPQPSDRREAERGYAHALTWSSGTIIGWSPARPPPAGESPPGRQRRRPGKRAFLLTPAGGMMSHPKRQAIQRSASSRLRGSGSRLGRPRAAPAAAWKAAATAGPQAAVTSTGPDARAGP